MVFVEIKMRFMASFWPMIWFGLDGEGFDLEITKPDC
jgi:hypothetical protein